MKICFSLVIINFACRIECPAFNGDHLWLFWGRLVGLMPDCLRRGMAGTGISGVREGADTYQCIITARMITSHRRAKLQAILLLCYCGGQSREKDLVSHKLWSEKGALKRRFKPHLDLSACLLWSKKGALKWRFKPHLGDLWACKPSRVPAGPDWFMLVFECRSQLDVCAALCRYWDFCPKTLWGRPSLTTITQTTCHSCWTSTRKVSFLCLDCLPLQAHAIC